MAWLKNIARDKETGDPFTTGNADIYGPDGTLLSSVALDAVTGIWEYKANGQPGLTTQEYDAGGEVKRVYGGVFGQAGPIMEGELEYYFRLFSDGVLSGMALSAPGSMNVQVATGYLFNQGVLHPIYTAENVTIDAADATHPRIDRIVSRRTMTGTFAGRLVLAVVKGTAAASPTAPALTKDGTTWEVEIGRVTVSAGASSITSGMLSILNKEIASAGINDGSVTQAKLAKPSVDTDELFDGAVTLDKLDTGIIVPAHPGFINTYWYSARSFFDLAITTLAIPANTLYSQLIYIPKAATITGVAFNLPSGFAGSTGPVRFGLYPVLSSGLPGTLLAELGTITATSAGVKSLTCSQAVDAGWYYLAFAGPGFGYNIYAFAMEAVFGGSAGRDVLGWASAGKVTSTGTYGVIAVNNNGVPLSGAHPTPAVTSGAMPAVWFRTSGT